MTAAEEVIWSVAGAFGEVPMRSPIDGFPMPAKRWVTDWLESPTALCGHMAELFARPFGSSRTVCMTCAEAANLTAYLARCGRCGRIAGPDGLGAFFATGRVLVFVSMCATCAQEGGFTDGR